MASRAEVESLQRQVSSLSLQLARTISEHDHEINKKDKLCDEIVSKRNQRYKKHETLLADMRSERTQLVRSLKITTAQLEAKKHTVQNLQQEVTVLCGKLETATARIKTLEERAAAAKKQTAPKGATSKRHPVHRERATTKPRAGRARLQKLVWTMERLPPARASEPRANVTAGPTTPPPPPAADETSTEQQPP